MSKSRCARGEGRKDRFRPSVVPGASHGVGNQQRHIAYESEEDLASRVHQGRWPRRQDIVQDTARGSAPPPQHLQDGLGRRRPLSVSRRMTGVCEATRRAGETRVQVSEVWGPGGPQSDVR